MNFLAHRGFWRERNEANSILAHATALAKGYGIEFDVRDANCQVVVAHDMVERPKPNLVELLTAYSNVSATATLAINIKADGLATRFASLLADHGITNYFCFDMSVPEMIHYRRLRLRYFTRHSEHEPSPVLYGDAAGVWMDMFESEWITPDDIYAHLGRGKQVALVSPELHSRPYEGFWACLRAAGLAKHPGLMLCTDHPDAARSFFDAED